MTPRRNEGTTMITATFQSAYTPRTEYIIDRNDDGTAHVCLAPRSTMAPLVFPSYAKAYAYVILKRGKIVQKAGR